MITIPKELWNYIYALIWEASNWTPRKRHFKKMICLKARDLITDLNRIHEREIIRKERAESPED